MDASYYPVLRARDSEMQAVSGLDSAARSRLSPIMRMYPSRKTEDNPIRNIYDSLEPFIKLLNGPVILDVESAKANHIQINKIFDDAGGYAAWRHMVDNCGLKNITPVVQILIGGSRLALQEQAKYLGRKYGRVAVSLSDGDYEAFDDVGVISEAIGGSENLSVIVDGGFIFEGNFPSVVGGVSDAITALYQKYGVRNFIPSFTSFRSGFKGSKGTITMMERKAFEFVCRMCPFARIDFSDHACCAQIVEADTMRAPTPRVDYPLEEACIYHRNSHKDGGYIAAAKAMIENELYEPINCWGCDQIKMAAGGKPEQLIAQFWTAVRINIHLTKRLIP